MPKPKTWEEVYESFKEKGLTINLEENVYVNSKTPIKCIDEDGYLYNLTLDNVQDKRTKSFSRVTRRNPFSIINIQHFLEDCGSKSILLSKEFLGNKGELIIQCECGEIFTTFWNRIHNLKKCRCNKCGYSYKFKNDSRKMSRSDLISELSKFNVILLDEEVPNIKNISVQDKEGYKYRTNYFLFKYGEFPEKFSRANPYFIDNVKLYLSLNKIPIKLLTEGSPQPGTKKLKFQCEQGETFEKSWISVAYYINKRKDGKHNQQNGSFLEISVEDYLIEKDIEYIPQYTFNDCRNIAKLRFDFFLPEFNTIIEVHGSQHYNRANAFDMTLEEQQERDKYKKDYCIKNGINYVEIPYWEITNYKEMFDGYKNIIDGIIK